MIHLTRSDYRDQPWANGRGITTELYRLDRDGALFCRLSMATVTEDGPFSVFPGIARNLTVLSGPGFRLEGAGFSVTARPLIPVAFAGDIAIRATGVTAPSVDFNVMTSQHLPRPEVRLIEGSETLDAGGTLALLALARARVDGRPLALHDLVVTQDGASVTGNVLLVRLPL